MAKPRVDPRSLRYFEETRPYRAGGHAIAAFLPDEDRAVGFLSTDREMVNKWEDRQRLSLAYVAPDLQRSGVGTTMYGLMHQRIGYPPLNDTALTAKADRWSSKLGVPRDKPAIRYAWPGTMEQDNAETITDRQRHMLNAQQFSPEDVAIAAPLPPMPKRRQKKMVQPELPLEWT